MLTVTADAGAHLTKLLVGSPDEAIVRIVRSNGRLKLRKDYEREGDVTFAHAGRVVLSLHPKVSDALASRTLRLRDGRDSRPRLSLKSV